MGVSSALWGPSVPGNRCWPLLVLSLSMGRNFPQVPPQACSILAASLGKGMRNLPQLCARAARRDLGKAASPRKLIASRMGRRGLQIAREGVFIIFGRWVVLLRFKCPAVNQSLPVRCFSLGRGMKSHSAVSSFPRFCLSFAFPRPLITQFSYHSIGLK